MSYSNTAWSIYLAIKEDINTEISQCEIENRNIFPITEDDLSFIGKYGKGIIIRIENDSMYAAASGIYEDRGYIYRLRAYINDPARDQKLLMDFVEHIKYVLQYNKTIITDLSYGISVEIEYPEPESENVIKTADLILEVLKDG